VHERSGVTRLYLRLTRAVWDLRIHVFCCPEWTLYCSGPFISSTSVCPLARRNISSGKSIDTAIPYRFLQIMWFPCDNMEIKLCTERDEITQVDSTSGARKMGIFSLAA